jgi:hypothetical protein
MVEKGPRLLVAARYARRPEFVAAAIWRARADQSRLADQ